VTALLIAVGVVTALAAATRSTWSPCGLSMLSTITPVSEAGRARRYRATAAWFIGGATLGGATLGALMAGLAAAVSTVHPGARAALGAGAAVVVVAAAIDAGLLARVGLAMPLLRRQVNERWLDQFRSWVYGGGFGWQIGAGFTTYLMTAAVPATALLGALTGRPAVAFGLGVVFGAARGLAVLGSARVRSAEDLRVLHRHLDRLDQPVRWAVVAVLGAATLALGAAWWWPAALVAAIAMGVGLFARVGGRRRARWASRAARFAEPG